MKHTAKQTTRQTLTDLYRALDHQHAITITYLDEDETEPAVRTIEIHAIRTSTVKVDKHGQATGGDFMITAMCRLRGARREFRLAGILTYTVHRMAYVLALPENTTYEAPEQQPDHDETALFLYELARDKDDADYRPRKLIQSDTHLAA
jgi:predicted DNA-binding transcriptional regulator YafY